MPHYGAVSSKRTIGPTPVELLANDYRAIYTWPQTTKNEAALVALNGRYSMTDHWTVQSNLLSPV